MSRADGYTLVFTAAARRGMNRLPASAAGALFEHLIGPVAENPYRLGKQLDAPMEELRSTRRGEYRALYTVDDEEHIVVVGGCRPSPRRIPAAVNTLVGGDFFAAP